MKQKIKIVGRKATIRRTLFDVPLWRWALLALFCASPALLLGACSSLGLAPPPPAVVQAAPAVTDAACALGLVQSAAAAVSAELEGVPAEWLAEQLCKDPEIVAAFMRAQKARSIDPGREAIAVARTRKLCR